MPIAVDAKGSIPVERVAGMLAARLDRIALDAPVVIMVHGFRYAPHRRAADPHALIMAPDAWPRHLGFGRGQTGLCVGFGWDALGSIWRARAEAAVAGRALATLIAQVRSRQTGPVGLLAHSLGARVALSSLAHVPAGSVTRMALLAGAEYGDTADAALNGTGTEVLNVTSRENDGYDFLYESLTAPFSGRRTVSATPTRAGFVTLQIDDDGHRAGLTRLGFPTRAPDRRICHWSAYSRPGLFPLYRRFLMEPAALPLPMLRAALPCTLSPRWSRLLAALPHPTLRHGDMDGTPSAP